MSAFVRPDFDQIKIKPANWRGRLTTKTSTGQVQRRVNARRALFGTPNVCGAEEKGFNSPAN